MYCSKQIVDDAEQEKVEPAGDIVQFSEASLKLGDDGNSWQFLLLDSMRLCMCRHWQYH